MHILFLKVEKWIIHTGSIRQDYQESCTEHKAIKDVSKLKNKDFILYFLDFKAILYSCVFYTMEISGFSNFWQKHLLRVIPVQSHAMSFNL